MSLIEFSQGMRSGTDVGQIALDHNAPRNECQMCWIVLHHSREHTRVLECSLTPVSATARKHAREWNHSHDLSAALVSVELLLVVCVHVFYLLNVKKHRSDTGILLLHLFLWLHQNETYIWLYKLSTDRGRPWGNPGKKYKAPWCIDRSPGWQH